MPLKSLVNHIVGSTLTKDLLSRIERKDRLILKGGSRTARSLLMASIIEKECKPMLLIVPTLEEATRWQPLINNMSNYKALIYPTTEISPYDEIDEPLEIIRGKLQVISELNIISDSNIVIITTDRALQPHLPPKEYIESKCIHIKKGDTLDIEILANKLAELGYQKTNNTDQEGYWSRRGDIIDIFTVSNDLPIRIELYGDQVDKIKEYDPISQRSLDEISQLNITPISFNHLIKERLTHNRDQIKDKRLKEEVDKSFSKNEMPKNIRCFKSIAWKNLSNIADYISKDTYVVFSERSQCIQHTKKWYENAEINYKELKDKYPFNKERVHYDANLMLQTISGFKGFDITQFDSIKENSNEFNISSKNINSYPNQFGKLSEDINNFINQKYSIWILSAQPSRVVALLEEHDCFAKFVPNIADLRSIKILIDQKVPVAIKSIGIGEIEGLNLAPWKIALFTDKEFFGQQLLSYSGYIRRKGRSASKTFDPNKLLPGDYVVHRNHGIGRFKKIEKLVFNNQSRDYILVEYSDGTLRVAADQLNSLSRFRSTGGKHPKINKMGGKSWLSIKERARKAINKVAIDLVKLYAERENTKGISFPKDGPWQKELEDSFQYDPTPDQSKAFLDVKNDMENIKPMDRLICGDVGYGKTEVAIRSIFKAITSGKQVALLAPTTVLSQQHWRTISDRFAPYPIKIALLNRFKTNKEKNKIVEDLTNGKIDAVIGTHQILSKKVNFKNLGLLVIDEEQRFGVAQKEKIKQLKKNVDVLTLTATPIPRTLYMSLSGVRKISLITTPPPLRRAIKTHLIPKDNEVIKSAISQELDRGGQIFYVVPRIEGIEEVAKNIKTIFPNINLLIAHGQMVEGDLESTMVAFNAGEADLMICTTIIESGLDIPRVNTILVEDAHNFGLSQLYQLRGRVGRSGVQAHAWLFYPKESIINEKATERLKAIQEFSELGSGYQLAMRDMEIRGVGNLIGTQQSGQIEAIGFDLYMEILQEAIGEIQGQEIPIVEDTKIDLPITAFIPSQWIENNEEKIAAYKAATECDSEDKLKELTLTWNDKYGKIPKAVETLIELIELKIKAKKCGFNRIKKISENIILETSMKESAFLGLRKSIPSHLHTRFIYKKLGTHSEIIIRGLGILQVEKQLETLNEWFSKMEAHIPQMNNLKLENIIK